MLSLDSHDEQTSSEIFPDGLGIELRRPWKNILSGYGDLAEYAEVTMALGILITFVGIVFVVSAQRSGGIAYSMFSNTSAYINAFEAGLFVSVFGAAIAILSAIITMIRH